MSSLVQQTGLMNMDGENGSGNGRNDYLWDQQNESEFGEQRDYSQYNQLDPQAGNESPVLNSQQRPQRSADDWNSKWDGDEDANKSVKNDDWNGQSASKGETDDWNNQSASNGKTDDWNNQSASTEKAGDWNDEWQGKSGEAKRKDSWEEW